MAPEVLQAKDNVLRVCDTSCLPQEVISRDFIAQAFPLVDPQTLEELRTADVRTTAVQSPSCQDINVDPHSLLSSNTRTQFKSINEKFADVFKPELPSTMASLASWKL